MSNEQVKASLITAVSEQVRNDPKYQTEAQGLGDDAVFGLFVNGCIADNEREVKGATD
jgi:hypothetical protein